MAKISAVNGQQFHSYRHPEAECSLPARFLQTAANERTTGFDDRIFSPRTTALSKDFGRLRTKSKHAGTRGRLALRYGNLYCGMVRLAVSGAAGAVRKEAAKRLPGDKFAPDAASLRARRGSSGPALIQRACGSCGRIGREAARRGEGPCRVMAREPGSARPVSAGRVAGASGQRFRARPCVRRSTDRAGELRLSPRACRQGVGQRIAGAGPARDWPGGSIRPTDHSGGYL